MQPSPTSILILGAGYAGLIAAIRLARQTPPTVEITLVNAVPTFRERVRDYEVAAGRTRPARQIVDILAGTRVHFAEATVESIDVDTRQVQTSAEEFHYDHAVWALGSKTATPVPGAASYAFRLDGPGAANLSAALEAKPGAKVAIVGGGSTSIEVATALMERQNAPTVSVVTEGILRDFPAKTQRRVEARLQALGIEIVNARVHAVESGRLLTTTGILNADIILWAAGLTANAVAATCGLPVDANGRLRVRETLECEAGRGLWGAGDAASVDAGAVAFGCKTALPLGAHVADNIARALAGETPTAFSFRDVGSFIATGRRHGVVQVGARDPFVSSGRVGAVAKELINHFANSAMRWERYGIGYRWPQAARITPPKAKRV